MNTFFRFFYEFVSIFFEGVAEVFKGIGKGFGKMFGFNEYSKVVDSYKDHFTGGEYVVHVHGYLCSFGIAISAADVTNQ